jgi:2-polyprenyl-3-methyl-5-hydroxy-6-metoxy-1,4-benzoquinol methylase
MSSRPATSAATGADPDAYYSQARPDILPLVPDGVRTVLDCGCGEGRLGEVLRGRGCVVTGIELHAPAAAAARGRLDRVLEGTIEQWLPAIEPESFDCIVCADVLEHLVDPWETARELALRLRPGGTLICSVPNIRHLAVVLDLVLRGRWIYRESGVLDRSHLRFFTRRGAIDMIRSAALQIDLVAGNAERFSGALAVAAICLRPLSREFRIAQWIIRARRPL